VSSTRRHAFTHKALFSDSRYGCSTYEDLVVLSIFRPLHPDLRITGEFETPGLACLHHCERSLGNSEQYWKTWPANECSIMSITPLYNCATTLVYFLQDQHSHGLFDQTCSMLLRLVNDFPLASFLLRGLKIVVGRMRLPLPSSAILYHHNPNPPTDALLDAPISFALPIHKWAHGTGEDLRRPGLEFGRVMTEWVPHKWLRQGGVAAREVLVPGMPR
jgi:hypothetical protein